MDATPQHRDDIVRTYHAVTTPNSSIVTSVSDATETVGTLSRTPVARP